MGHYSVVVYDKMKILLLFLLHICTIHSSEDLPPSKEGVRQPKILLVTTTTTTSTLKSAYNCWVGSNTVTGVLACKKRRDLMESYLEDGIKNTDEMIMPSKTVSNEADPNNDLDESRKGKFLNYFLTVTSTYTFTSFTATSTIASLTCTPPGWTMHGCKGSQGK